MNILGVNSCSVSAKNSLNFAAEKINPKDTNPISYYVAGEKGDRLSVTDKNYALKVENISDPKVGSKYLVTFTNPKYEGLTILFKPNSVMKAKDGSVNLELIHGMPSFAGRLYGSIRRDEDGTIDTKMKNAYLNFWRQGMHTKIQNKYLDKGVKNLKDDYNFYIPSDGDGTRFKDVTKLQGKVTKPASHIPAKLNGSQMSLIHSVITNYTKTGKLTEGVDFIPITPAKGSAYAFLEGIKCGKIPVDKPLVFTWGDNFSDINFTNILKEHERLNSGFTVHTLLTDENRIKAFAATEIDNLKDKNITWLKEKPTKKEEIDRVKIPEYNNRCLGSVGPYVISVPALKWIKENYTNNPESFLNPEGKGYDFSSMIIARMQKEFQAGKILDENGNPLRMKAVIMGKKETWSDLGGEKDFSEAMYNIKKGSYKGLPKEVKSSIAHNVDKNGNITFNEKTKEYLKQVSKDLGIEFKNTISYFQN